MPGVRLWESKSGKVRRCNFGGAEKSGEIGGTAGERYKRHKLAQCRHIGA